MNYCYQPAGLGPQYYGAPPWLTPSAYPHQTHPEHHQDRLAPHAAPSTAMTSPQGSLVPIPGLDLLHAMPSAESQSHAPLPPDPPAVVRAKPAKKGIKRKSARLATKTNPPSVARPGTKPISRTAIEPSAADRNDPKEKRQAPSRESGGVPEPSPLYLARAFAPPSALPQPRRILVILDLNGTVLYRPTRRQPTTFVERPHARRFLAYCLEVFHLAIWSSARPENVQQMLAQLLTSEQRERCVVTWARDRLGLSRDDYDSRVQCYKRLAAMWSNDKVQASHPTADRGGRWDQSNTVLVDDSRGKGRSEPHNMLAVPEFAGLEGEMADVLPQVHDYLKDLCYQEDISRYMRLNPFKLNPSYQLSAAPPPGA